VNAPKWRTFQPGVKILIAPVNRTVRREIRRLAQEQSGSTIEEIVLDRLLRRHMVRDWSGICDTAGNALPCTPENIDAVLAAFAVLEDWISAQAATMAEAEAKDKALALKNSKDSHDGPQADQGA
jgi:hypothetical protein